MEDTTSKEDKKEEEKEVAANEDAAVEEASSKKEEPRQDKITWIMVGVVIILVGGLFFFSKNENVGTDKEEKSEENAEVTIEVDTEDPQQWSYALGYILGQQLEQMLEQEPSGAEVDNDTLTKAINDVLNGKETKYTEAEVQKIMEVNTEKQQESLQAKAEENKTMGQAYVDEYAKTEGVIKTENGTLYTVKTVGEGAPVGEGTAIVQYRGTLIDGTEFDSSNKNGQDTPVPFDPASVIPGFGEALSQMKKGSQWEIVIPSDQAYGEQGVPGLIDPNSALIFEVTVVDIEKTE